MLNINIEHPLFKIMDVLTNWKVANMAIDIKNDYNNWIEIMERYPREKKDIH